MLVVGEHRLRVEAPKHLTISRPLAVDGTDGEVLRFYLRPQTDPPGFPQAYRFTLVTTGVSLAFAGAAMAVNQSAVNEYHRLKQVCANSDCLPQQDKAAKYHRLRSLRGGMIAASVAIAVVAVVLFFVERTKKRWRDEGLALRDLVLHGRF